jgi:hypothetical protein
MTLQVENPSDGQVAPVIQYNTFAEFANAGVYPGTLAIALDTSRLYVLDATNGWQDVVASAGIEGTGVLSTGEPAGQVLNSDGANGALWGTTIGPVVVAPTTTTFPSNMSLLAWKIRGNGPSAELELKTDNSASVVGGILIQTGFGIGVPGGDINIAAGPGTPPANMFITTASGAAAGSGGTILVETGSGAFVSGTGGLITLKSGFGTAGGPILLKSGDVEWLEVTKTDFGVKGALTLTEVATPANPAAGFDKLYFKADDKLYRLNSAGVEAEVGAFTGDTDDVPEGATNLYFTEARVLSTDLAGFVSGAGAVTAADTVLTAFNKVDGNTALKAPSDSPTFTTTAIFGYATATTVPFFDGSKALVSSAVTTSELGFLSGVTSAVQTQLNAKAPLASPVFTGDVDVSTGNLLVSTAGKGIRIKEGANARMGVATLVAGTVTVANTSITATTRIFLSNDASGGVVGALAVSARTVGTDFTITSTSVADTSQIAWELKEPA